MKVLEEYGVKGRLLRAIRSLYVRTEACVRVRDKESDWFQITQGVRQGCVMSPWLFNVCMDTIVREVMAVWAAARVTGAKRKEVLGVVHHVVWR